MVAGLTSLDPGLIRSSKGKRKPPPLRLRSRATLHGSIVSCAFASASWPTYTTSEADRPSPSCVQCRLRKVKCDRAQPSCSRCLRNDFDCEYARKRRPGPRRGHAQSLHNKVDCLERSVESLSSQLQERSSPSQQYNLRTTTSWLSNEHYKDQATPGMPPDAALGHVQSLSSEDDRPLASSGLPPIHHLKDIVNLFFESINNWLPFLLPEFVMELLRDPVSLDEPEQILLHALVVSGLRFWEGPEEARKSYLQISKRRVQSYVLTHTNIRSLQALVILAWEAIGEADFAQSMNLLTLLAQNISQLGWASEPRFDLGLFMAAPAGITQASLLPRADTWYHQEEKRRLFWVSYALDRYINTSTSSDFRIDEKQVNRPLPCRLSLWSAGEQVETRWYRTDEPFKTIVDAPENLGSFSYLCEVTRIMTQIHEFVKRPLDFYSADEVNSWRASYNMLDEQLSAWLASLPGEPEQRRSQYRSLGLARSQATKWITLQSSFILASLRLHSVAGYPPMASELFQPSHSAMQKCLAAVTSMLSVAKEVVDQDMLGLLGPPFTGSLWVAARLLLVHASVQGHHLDPSIHFYIATLERMGQTWPVAREFSFRLKSMLPHAQPANGLESLGELRR